jgi:hypothetical protein
MQEYRGIDQGLMGVRILATIHMLHSQVLTAEFRKYVCDEIYILNNLDATEFGGGAALLELWKRYQTNNYPLFGTVVT